MPLLSCNAAKHARTFCDERDGPGCQMAPDKPKADGHPCSGPIVLDHTAEIRGARKQWSEFTHHASEILTDCDFYLRILEQQTKPKEPDLFKQEAA